MRWVTLNGMSIPDPSLGESRRLARKVEPSRARAEKLIDPKGSGARLYDLPIIEALGWRTTGKAKGRKKLDGRDIGLEGEVR